MSVAVGRVWGKINFNEVVSRPPPIVALPLLVRGAFSSIEEVLKEATDLLVPTWPNCRLCVAAVVAITRLRVVFVLINCEPARVLSWSTANWAVGALEAGGL